MRKNWWRPLILLFIVSSLFKCIDPFSPQIGEFQSLIVVDALLTDENVSNYVYLSRTIEKVNDEPAMVSGALVIIKDNFGNSTTLSETSEGKYKTDSLVFRGEIGRSYTLYIKTADGQEYQSESCLMYPVQNIDSLYYFKDQEIIDDEPQEGIRIYFDSKGDSDCKYYRWTYEEWWKFKVPNPKLYDYESQDSIIEYPLTRETCLTNNKSEEIIIKSTETDGSNRFEKEPILFLASDKSDRLLIQYYIKVRQLSISQEEYDFWDKMNKINENGGDIFDKQPFEISGNIHNINKPTEQVLGYFQVSGATVKSLYITKNQIRQLNLPVYKSNCTAIVIGPSDFPVDPRAGIPPPTFDEIYRMYSTVDCVFVEPVYSPSGGLYKLKFATRVCSDCTKSGSQVKPDFWVDMD